MTTTPTLALHTLRGGFGPPIVLLHAFPLDHRMWSPLAEALPGDPPVLAVDLPGLGDTPTPTATPSLDWAADAVAATIERYARAVVVGVSMGGYVALALVDRHPGLVAGLGLLDTKSTADGEAARENRLRIADRIEAVQTIEPVVPMASVLIGDTSRAERPHLTARIEGWIRGQHPAGAAWSQRAMAARPDRTEALRRYAGPVLVARGAEDALAPAADAEHMVDAARDVESVTVPGAGHLAAVEAPEGLAVAIAALRGRAG